MKQRRAVHSRRRFLSIAATGTAGIILFPYARRTYSASPAQAGWRNGLAINPSIDNIKAICCYDEAMVPTKYATDFARQNEGINTALIAKNMDEIATKLTNIRSRQR